MVPEPLSALPSDPRSPAACSDPGPRVPSAARAHLDNPSLGMSQPRPSPGAFPHLPSEPRTPRAFPETGSRVLPSRQECQQALSHWLSNQVPRRAGERRCPAMPSRARSASQDRLEDMTAHRQWPCSTSQGALSQLGQEGWHRARSDDYLSRASHSAEALGPGALVSPRFERCGWSSQRPSARTPACQPRDLPGPQALPPPGLQGLDDIGYIGYRSYSPSFQRRTGLLHALSFRDSPFGGLPTFNLAQSAAPFLPEASEPSRVIRPEPIARGLEPPTEDHREEVVLRQKPPTGRKIQLPPARQMNLGFSDESPEPETSGRGERLGRKVAPLATTEDSLASIPFIGEWWCRVCLGRLGCLCSVVPHAPVTTGKTLVWMLMGSAYFSVHSSIHASILLVPSCILLSSFHSFTLQAIFPPLSLLLCLSSLRLSFHLSVFSSFSPSFPFSFFSSIDSFTHPLFLSPFPPPFFLCSFIHLVLPSFHSPINLFFHHFFHPPSILPSIHQVFVSGTVLGSMLSWSVWSNRVTND